MPLRAHGRNVVDARGRRFKLASVNWYGASDELFIPGGLDIQHRDVIAATIRVGTSSSGVAVSPDGTTAYVINSDNSGFGTVSVINTATNAVTNTISVGIRPTAVTVSPDGSTAYVTNSGEDAIAFSDEVD